MSNEPAKVNDYLMYLDKSDLSQIIRNNGYFELETTELAKSLIKPTDICLDIGSHIGYFTLLMAKRCSFVHAFEPNIENYITLQSNVRLNKLNNVITHNIAIAQSVGSVTLCLNNTNSGMHRIYCVNWCSGNHYVVDTRNIDSLFSKVDFIKMDAEGSEYGALLGMENVLRKNDIKMIMEFHPPSIREYGIEPKKIFEFMEYLGYEVTLIGSNPNFNYEYIEKITSDPKGGYNLLCQKK